MYSILIIDSDKEFNISLRRFLKREGYKVYYSRTGKSGLQKAKDKKPNLVLMESAFPDTDGMELLKNIKFDAELAKVHLIVFTFKDNEFDKVLALELGADDYINKTASYREIAARLKSQFRYSVTERGYLTKNVSEQGEDCDKAEESKINVDLTRV